jgi:hypothetical protein
MQAAQHIEKYEFTKISVDEAAKRLQLNPQTIRRSMQADYEALAIDEHAALKFPFGMILKGYGGDNIYLINGDAIDRWLEAFKERSNAAVDQLNKQIVAGKALLSEAKE